MKKICVITGTRAEYGLSKPIMKSIENHPNLKLSIIATGMHLSKEFGLSLNEIVNNGFEVTEKVRMNPNEDSGFSMAKSIGRGIIGISKALKKIKPDMILVLGDRIEVLAGTIAAAYMNIPVAHLGGGDITKAGLDEPARHAITRFANIHFTTTEKSAKNILKMGEDKWRIFNVGSPSVDTILHEKFLSKREIEKKFSLDLKKPFILMIQHAVTTEPEKAEKQIMETLKAIEQLKIQTIVIYPNSDAGGRKIIKKIKKYEKKPFIKTFKNLSQKEYFSLLKYAGVLVGNSSSGIIETPSFHLPVVNIGIRQEDRERGGNVIDVESNKDQIVQAVERALFDEKFKERIKKSKNPYGDGNTSKRIVKILNEIKIDKRLLQKKINY